MKRIDTPVYIVILVATFIVAIVSFLAGVWLGSRGIVRLNNEIYSTINASERKFASEYEEKYYPPSPVLEKKQEKPKEKKELKEDNKIKNASVKKETNKKVDKGLKKREKKTLVKNNSKKQKVKKANRKGKTTPSKEVKKDIKETRYMLQIGAYNRYNDALRLKKRFEKKGYSVFVIKEKGKKKVFYKVRIGTFYSKKIALKVKKRLLKEDGIRAWLVPIK